MTEQQAFKFFKSMYRDFYKEIKTDYSKVQLTWSLFIGELCRNGNITLDQYNGWNIPF